MSRRARVFDQAAYSKRYYKERYEKRKEERKCTKCGEDLPDNWGKFTCPTCAEKIRAEAHDKYMRYKLYHPKPKKMSLTKAKSLLDALYAKAIVLETVKNPLAHALHELMKEVNYKTESDIDLVGVVHCKDCAKDGLSTCPICYIENHTLQFINHDPDFFCAWGEKK